MRVTPVIGPPETPTPTPGLLPHEGSSVVGSEGGQDYLLVALEREHEQAWTATAAGVAEMGVWTIANGLPPISMIVSGTIKVWRTALGPVVRYETFVIDHVHGGWETDARSGLPRRQPAETPYRVPLPDGVGHRYDRLPFPPADDPDVVQCEGQLSL